MFIPAEDALSDPSCVMARLRALPAAAIAAKQRTLAQLAGRLQAATGAMTDADHAEAGPDVVDVILTQLLLSQDSFL